MTPDKPSAEVHTLWLQKAEPVADQSFESFAIFARGARNVITTSRRKPGWDGQSEASSVQLATGVLGIVGTITTLCGFFLQFTGLRGMH